MPRPKKLDIDPANVDVDGICASQTPLGAGSLTINGALTSGGVFHVNTTGGDSVDISGKQIVFTYAADETGRTFTITGTDENGNAQTSTVAGTGIGIVEDVKYWKTITDISVDAATAGAITVGTVDEIITRTIPLNHRSQVAATVAVMGVTGTCQFDVDETFDAVMADGSTSATNWITNQSNKSADLSASLSLFATGVRLKFDSYTDGAELQFHILQGNEQ